MFKWRGDGADAVSVGVAADPAALAFAAAIRARCRMPRPPQHYLAPLLGMGKVVVHPGGF